MIELPSPPTNLKVSVNGALPANLTWISSEEEIDVIYSVHAVNITTNSTILRINTSEMYFEYNLSIFRSCGLSSVRFSVKTIRSQSVICSESKESRLKGFPDVPSAISACQLVTGKFNSLISNYYQILLSTSQDMMHLISLLMVLVKFTMVSFVHIVYTQPSYKTLH